MTAQEARERQILERIRTDALLTQRGLSSELGIALGLTNLLLRRLVKKGWVRVKRVSPRRLKYLVTPSGAAAQARLTRAYLHESLRHYRQSRDRIRERFADLCRDARRDPESGPIVFLGGGEIAEIAYVCLQETPLELLGVATDAGAGCLFRADVRRLDALSGQTFAGRPFWRLVVMPLQDEPELRRLLAARSVPVRAAFWL
jgi:DNA-binding MarR family transcriptional regulator